MSCLWGCFGLRRKKRNNFGSLLQLHQEKAETSQELAQEQLQQQQQLHEQQKIQQQQLYQQQHQQHHQFRTKRVRRERPCHACHRPLTGRVSCCRVCKYVCHETCEYKEDERFSDTSWQIHRQWREGEGPSWPGLRRSSPGPARPASAGSTPLPNAKANSIQTMPDTNGTPSLRRSEDGDITLRRMGSKHEAPSYGQMELSYVTERILVLWIPGGAGVTNANKVAYEREAAHMLHNKHGQNYMIFNLTERRKEVGLEHSGRVCELGWRNGLAPPLEGLCNLCKTVNQWLSENNNRVAVLRSCGSRERFIVAISSYLQYSSICSQQKQLVDRHVMKRFLDNSNHVTVAPSHKRYVEYFASLLAGTIKVNPASLLLTHVTVVGAPPMSHVFLKLYEGIVPVYTSNVYFLGPGTRQFTATLGPPGIGNTAGGVGVRGDVLLRCYTRSSPLSSSQSAVSLRKSDRSLLFSCQFHTCAVSDFTIIFTKNELDEACHNEQFAGDGSVEIQVAGGRPCPAPTPSVRVHSVDDALSRWDSLQDMHIHSSDDEDVQDGGTLRRSESGAGEGPIYATVARRPPETGTSAAAASAGGGTASPLSASMDSGISSAGRRQGSPSPSSRRRELDEVLRAMLRTVEELPVAPLPSAATPSVGTPPPPTHPDIPYHARPDSRPFTYGSPLNDAGMLRAQAGLSSPSLVRRALNKPPLDDINFGLDTYDGPRNGFSDRDSSPDPIDRIFSHEANESFRRRELRESSRETPRPVTPRKEERRLTKEDLLNTTTTTLPGRSNSFRSNNKIGFEDVTPRRYELPLQRSEESMTWLQRQQQRLRARQTARQNVARMTLERPLPPGRTSASHRFDGYTSDTTAFADDDDDFGLPLQVSRAGTLQNSFEPALPNRVSSRKYMTLERTTVRERSVSPGERIPDMMDSPISRQQSVLSYTDRSCNGTVTHDESVSSWRSVSVSEVDGEDGYSPSRGTTPAFPTAPCTPYPPATPPSRLPLRSPVMQRKDYSQTLNSQTSTISNSSTLEPMHDVSPDLVKFVRDTSKFWYKPNISRDEAISLLHNQDVGSFIIRDSNSFPNAFGMAIKVTPPHTPGVSAEDSVRHFLIEPTSRGVRLKGCADEPIFSSLSALVYQHSVTLLALPVALKLPQSDPAPPGPMVATRELLAAGAACSVLYLGGAGCEALTGPEAIARVTNLLLSKRPLPVAVVVHFKVSGSGITLTDSTRRLFFRRHYPTSAVSHCGLDPENRKWNYPQLTNGSVSNRIFGFVSRKVGNSNDNECHIFTELEPEQPATAIVNFVSKVMLGQTPSKNIV